MDEFLAIIINLSGQFARVLWIAFSALAWALWTVRNKFTIEHIFPNKHVDVLFKMAAFLQQWSPLTKAGDVECYYHDGCQDPSFCYHPVPPKA